MSCTLNKIRRREGNIFSFKCHAFLPNTQISKAHLNGSTVRLTLKKSKNKTI